MKITVDTKEDSRDDIRKVIKMLQHLVGENAYSNYEPSASSRNIFDDPSPSLGSSSYPEQEPQSHPDSEPTNAFSAMFADEPTTQTADSGILPYDEEEEKEKRKIDWDAEIVPY